MDYFEGPNNNLISPLGICICSACWGTCSSGCKGCQGQCEGCLGCSGDSK